MDLFVTEPLTFWIVLAITIFQIAMSYTLRDSSPLILFICTYVISGTLNHSLQLASHELAHDLCWSGPNKDAYNRLTAIMSNLVTGLPSSQTFKPYHMDHHQYQGVDGIDTDVPHPLEVKYVNNAITKTLWIIR